jgi:hypothetical protein
MKMNIFIMAILLTFGTIAPAIAAREPCYLSGRWYDHGTKVGSYLCQHGQWIKV